MFAVYVDLKAAFDLLNRPAMSLIMQSVDVLVCFMTALTVSYPVLYNRLRDSS